MHITCYSSPSCRSELQNSPRIENYQQFIKVFFVQNIARRLLDLFDAHKIQWAAFLIVLS